MGRSGKRESGRHRSACSRGRAGIQMFSDSCGNQGFSMVTEQGLRRALPHVARTGLPLLVHAELAGPVEAATVPWALPTGDRMRPTCNRGPDEAELSAIRLLISLCREYEFPSAYRSSPASLRRCRNCGRLGPKGFRSASKRARIICIWRQKQSRTGRRFANVRRQSAAAKIAKNLARAEGWSN